MADLSSILLTKLPVEILSKILLYLNTYDVFQVCFAFPELECMTYDAVILRKVQLAGEFRFQHVHISEYLLHRYRRSLIVSLDISYNYWLTKTDLRRIVKGLPNLQHLYAFDTNLPVLCNTGLKTVALTYSCSSFFVFPVTINDMHLHVHGQLHERSHLHAHDTNITTSIVLKEILRSGEEQKYDNLNNLHITAIHRIPFEPSAHFYNIRSSSTARELRISFINYQDIRTMQTILISNGWIIQKRHCTNKRDPKTFTLGNTLGTPLDSESVAYEEVQIKLHSVQQHDFLTRKLFQSNLNIASLKRLTLSWSHCVQKLKSQTSAHLFKKPRLQPEFIVGSSILEMFIQFCPLIQELNITFEVTDKPVCDCARALAELKHLQKLTLFVPLRVNLKFLVDVGKNCTNLTSLKVDLLAQSDNFIMYLALPYMKSLKELALSQDSIDIKRLLDAIDKTAKTIVRLSLTSTRFKNLVYMEKFLKNNPQLVFCRTLALLHTKADEKYLNAVLKKCRRNPVQYFTSSDYDVPEIHQDMSLFNGKKHRLKKDA